MKSKIIGIAVGVLILVPVVTATTAMSFGTSWYQKKNDYSVPHPSSTSSIITIALVATVTEVTDSYTLLGGAIHVNDTLTGKYIYNTGEKDWDPDPNNGTYWYTSSPYGFEVNIDIFDFATNPNMTNFLIGIGNDYSINGSPPEDIYIVASLKNLPLSNGLKVNGIEWDLRDTTATALRNDHLPTTAPVLSDWDSGQGLFIEGSSPSYPSHTFKITAHVTQATKNNAINTLGIESTLSKIVPNHYNMPFVQLWMRIFELFPNAFSILHHILGFDEFYW